MTSQSRHISIRSSSLLALIGLAFVASGAAIWLLRPKLTASAQLHLAIESPSILFQPEANQANNAAHLRSQTFFIKSRPVLAAAMHHLPKDVRSKLEAEQADPVQWLHDALTVDFPSQEFIQISLSGDRPDDLKEIVASVAMTYMENYVNKDRIKQEEPRKKLEARRQEFTNRLRDDEHRLWALRQQAGGDDESRTSLVQRLALEELRSVETDLVQVRRELRHLRVELSLHLDWFDEVWPQYAAALNCQPRPGLPVNHALVALLHDDAHLLHQAEQADRPQKKERLRLLTVMETAFLREAEHLNQQMNFPLRYSEEVGQLRKEIDQKKKLLQGIDDKLFKLEVERDAPPRISWPDREPFVSTSDATERKWMTRAAAVLAGLGILVFAIAGIKFRYSKAT